MEGKTLTNEKRFYPLLVSSGGLEPQSEEESEQVWERLEHIPVNNKSILLSRAIVENLYNAEKTFGWEPLYSARLTFFVRELFFQSISQSEFYKAVEAVFSQQYQPRFNEILAYINNIILTSQPDPEEDEDFDSAIPEENVKQYTLLDALSKFSNLSQQVITAERIKLKSSAEPVRPTLSNWLKNYRDELGIGMHDAVARAKFLFETSNTKKLSSAERDRIHAMVRSLEDNELLSIDTKKQEIVFQNLAKEKSSSSKEKFFNEPQGASPDIFERFQNVSQSSSRPEELKNVGTQTFGGGKVNSREEKGEELALLSQIKNMFVSPPKANAPAPKEDFQETVPEASFTSKEPAPMGTIRFSAKHVLPAERQIQKIPPTAFPGTGISDSRLEHFRPQAVPIPGDVQNFPVQQPAPFKPPAPVPAPKAASPEPPPVKTDTTEEKYEPINMFRIKPNRD